MTTFSIDKTCGFSLELTLEQLVQFTQWCGWSALVDRTPVDKSGNLLSKTATVFAGYQIDITYVAFRDAANGVLPTFVQDSLQGTFATSFTQV